MLRRMLDTRISGERTKIRKETGRKTEDQMESGAKCGLRNGQDKVIGSNTQLIKQSPNMRHPEKKKEITTVSQDLV